METPPHSQKFIKVFLLLITFLWITQTSLSIVALPPPPQPRGYFIQYHRNP